MEQWAQLIDYPRYEVSELGRVRHIKHKKIRALRKNPDGYLLLNIRDKQNVLRTVRIHRLVAFAFLPQREGYNLVDHINRDREDNRLINLRWCNHSENLLNRKVVALDAKKIKRIIDLHVLNHTPEEILDLI